MGRSGSWVPVIAVALDIAWALAIALRLFVVARRWPSLGQVSARPRMELILRLSGGAVVLAFAVGYAVIGLRRGPMVPYAWMGAHSWVFLLLFVANISLFAVVVFPIRRAAGG